MRTAYLIVTFAAITGSATVLYAQSPSNPQGAMSDMNGMHSMQMSMPSSIAVTDPMSREGSGTSWLPDSTPTYAKMWMLPNGNMLMVHGAAMPRYTDVGSTRGDHKFDAPNWAMGMFTHPLTSTSQLGIHLMMSLDPITESGYGYPLLYQTGETWNGHPLRDRQHPHDLFSELSATYSKDIGNGRSAYLYIGYPGEPALGPPAYMHRLIASDLADAPIGHHWQDATHITFGVATVGLGLTHNMKVEASSFTGREPNENRYNFDQPRFDSGSGRLSWNPDSRNALAISYGYIKNPEGDGVDQHRQAASWIYDKPLGTDANITTTLSWGQNDAASGAGMGVSNSYLEELDYQKGRDTLFSRLEQIQKSGAELVLPGSSANNTLYWLGEYTVGYVHDIKHGGGMDTGIGAAISVDPHPSSLNQFYGGNVPISFQVFLRLRASRMDRNRGADMSSMDMAGMGMSKMPGVQHQPEPIIPATQSQSATVPAPTVALPIPTTEEQPTMPLSTPPTTSTKPPAVIQSAKPVSNVLLATSLSPAQAVAGKPETVTVTLTSSGKLVSGASVTADVAMASMDMGTSHPKFKEIAPGKYQGNAVFTMSGGWKVTVHAKVGKEKPVTKVVLVTAGY